MLTVTERERDDSAVAAQVCTGGHAQPLTQLAGGHQGERFQILPGANQVQCLAKPAVPLPLLLTISNHKNAGNISGSAMTSASRTVIMITDDKLGNMTMFCV